MEAGSGGGSPMQPSFPYPKPKSPPQYPDLYGKRKELAKVQMLEREIGYLQEELKFFDGIPPASQSCKEVADIVMAKPDPLIVMSKKKRRRCRFWKWLCGMSCLNISYLCCCCRCSPSLRVPSCCGDCRCSGCQSCCGCSMPKCNCCFRHCCKCFKTCNCSLNCCIPKCLSCSDFSCKRCSSCCWLRCPKVNFCCSCTKNCCYPCFCFF